MQRERVVWSFFFSSRRRHTRLQGDWSSDVCSSDLPAGPGNVGDCAWPSCWSRCSWRSYGSWSWCSPAQEVGRDQQQRECAAAAFGSGNGLGRARAQCIAGQQSGCQRARIDAVAGLGCEPLRQLDTAYQRIGRSPAGGDVVVAGRRAGAPHWLAELVEQAGGLSTFQLAPAQCAHGRDGPFPGRLELRGWRGPGFWRIDQGAVDGWQVPAAALVGGRKALQDRESVV